MAAAYRITDVTSLRGILSTPRNTRVVVSLPGFATNQSGELERQLNRLSSACGCNMSAAFFVIAVVTSAVTDVILWPDFERHFLVWLGANLFACILAIGIGRQVGISHARLKLVRLIRHVETQMTNG